MRQSFVGTVMVAGSLLSGVPSVGTSQARAPIRPIAAVSVAMPGPLHPPRAAPMMLGLGAGLELVHAGVAWRPHVGFHRGVGPSGDDLSICLGPGPDRGQCHEPAYSRSAGTGGIDVLIAPRQARGVFATLGGGLTVFSQRPAEPSPIDIPRTRGHWRAGVGVTLGSGQRAPRLEFARTVFAGAAGSAHRWTSVGLWVR